MLTPSQSSAVLAAGLACFVAGLTWALGPYALAGCGLVVVLAALLLPHRPPTEAQIAEALRKALDQS